MQQQLPHPQNTANPNQRRAWVTPSMQKMAAGDAENNLLLTADLVVLT